MDLKPWKVLKKEDVSPSKWFPVERHEVELPNGNIVDDYYLSSMGDFVMIVPVSKSKEIFFVKQYKHGVGEIVIELPAGFIKPEQSMEGAAVAELEEETGIKVETTDLIKLGKLSNLPTKLLNYSNSFLVKDVEVNSVQNFDENEEIEVLKIPAEEVLEQIKTGKIWMADTIAVLMLAYLQHPDIFSI